MSKYICLRKSRISNRLNFCGQKQSLLTSLAFAGVLIALTGCGDSSSLDTDSTTDSPVIPLDESEATKNPDVPQRAKFIGRGYAVTESEKQCRFTQIYAETNPHFMPDNLQSTTHHDLWTIQFDDPSCMKNSSYNRTEINKILAYVMSNTSFRSDIRFDLKNLRPPGRLQARGKCIHSISHPEKGISVEYFTNEGSIWRVMYMETVDTCGT